MSQGNRKPTGPPSSFQNSFSKMSISTKSHGLVPRHARRDQLSVQSQASKAEVSVEFMKALNNSGVPNTSHTGRKISPGRAPSNREKAKSPGRDTCRHIPPRDHLNHGLASHRANYGIEKKSKDENQAKYQTAIDRLVNPASRGGDEENSSAEPRIINFQAQAPRSDVTKKSNSIFSTSASAKLQRRAKVTRHIPSDCDRVLDAPGLDPNYYINPLDWSADRNVLVVALGGAIYLWTAETGDTEALDISGACDEAAGEYISSVRFIKGGGGPTLAIGLSNSDIVLYDIVTGKRLRKMSGHADVVNALDWRQYILSSSCTDGSIFHHDVRQRVHKVGSFLKHTQVVPGLAWSHNDNYLASGSNDNSALIWDARNMQTMDYDKPLHTLDAHTACVKAVAWNPRQPNVLATGGGTADRSIKIWNAISGHETLSIDTGSQVCSIVFSQNYDEFVSAHGYQLNQLSLWSYPNGTKITDLYGHEERVLHLCPSPDGSVVCSGSEDETLRFWKIFAPDKTMEKRAKERQDRARNNKLTAMPKLR